MYDPKFEKAIQQKMEELEFRPPESVWVNIERAVVVKRRRRTGYLWRYVLPAAFLVAAAGIYLHYAAAPAGASAGALADGKTTSRITAPGATATTASTAQAAGGASINAQTSTNAQTAVNTQTVVNAQTATNERTSTNAHASTNRPTLTRRNASTHEYSSASESASTRGNTPTRENTSTDENMATSGLTSAAGRTSTAGAAGQKARAAWFYQPGLADLRLTPQIQGAALNTKKSNLASLAKLSHPQRHWEAGFVAGGGLSRLNRLNSEQAKAALTSTVTSLYAFAGASSDKTYISNTQPDASFDGGIYLQKELSGRWTFNTGMNLHYYSNRISVGQQLTTYVQASASYFIPTTSAAVRNTSMYSAGNTRSFTNKYYFLELPAGLQWKLSKNHLLPIFLEGGVSLSRLMGASALFYDAKTGLYSKDGDVVNKTQLNVSSALLVGLPFHGIAIQLGPEIQYGLTPLVNTQGLGDQHFLYTGIRVVIIPGRK